MIGGQIIIQIRDTNGNKVSITSTAKSLKAGTFAKIKRAVDLQKEIVFEDVIVGGYNYTSGGGILGIRKYDNVEYVRVAGYYPAGATTGASFSFYISSNDTIVTGT